MRALRLASALALVLSVACSADRVSGPGFVTGGAGVVPIADTMIVLQGVYDGGSLFIPNGDDLDPTEVLLIGPHLREMLRCEGFTITIRGRWTEEGAFDVDSYRVLQ